MSECEIVLLDTSERECRMSSNVSICWCMTDSISAEFPLLSLAWSVRESCVSDGIPYRYILSPVLQYDKNIFPYFISVSGS